MWSDFYNHRNWKLGGLSILFGLPWYLYIPLANRAPFLNIGGTSIADYYNYCCSQSFLWGDLAVMDGRFSVSSDFWGRVWDLSRLLVGGFGLALALLYLAIKQEAQGKAWFLPALLGLIVLYYFTNLDPSIYTYTILAFALGAILIGKLSYAPRTLQIAAGIFGGVALIFNAWAYNIGGQNLDPYHSAELFEQALSRLPSDAVVWSHNRGWEKFTTLRYNLDHGTTFDVVNIEKPVLSRAETYVKLTQAHREERLYRTRILDAYNHEVRIEPTTPGLVMADIESNQWLRGWE